VTANRHGQTLHGAIDIDATALPGADGAPVLNAAGDLIGIVDTITRPLPRRRHRPLAESAPKS